MPNEFLINTETVKIESDGLLMETFHPTGVNQPEAAGNGYSYVPEVIDADTLAQTRKLMDSAIISAWHAVKSERRPLALTPTRWVWRLAGYYHLSYCTPRLLEQARDRYALGERHSLAEWAGQKAKEEASHYLLALRDIQSMGYEAEGVVEACFPPDSKALMDYFTQSVQDSAIDCIGYSYTAERLAISMGEVYIKKVEALLPHNTNATRYLRAHSTVSTSEMAHVQENLVMIAGLTPQDRDRVARASYQVASLCFNPCQEAYISDEEIQNILNPLKLTNNQN